MKNQEVDRQTASQLFSQLWEMGAIGSHELGAEAKKLIEVHGQGALDELSPELQKILTLIHIEGE